MNRIAMRTAARLALPVGAALGLTACPDNGGTPLTPQATSVRKTVTTLQKLDGIATCGSAPNPPDVQLWWNRMPAANHDYPFAGWMTSRVDPGGCALNHVDQYRAVVYTLPPGFTPGPLAGAASPTTITAGGLGRATITTDVTSQVTAALNGRFASLSWILTGNFEGPLPFELPVAGELDCRTSYEFDLRITHR